FGNLSVNMQDYGLTKDDWGNITDRAKNGKLTPLIGAGACAQDYPSKVQIAKEWADEEEEYPFHEKANLAQVAQFVAVKHDDGKARQKLIDRFKRAQPLDFMDPKDPHYGLAKLELPVYITTNYDSFMTQALTKLKRKDVTREYCRWGDQE